MDSPVLVAVGPQFAVVDSRGKVLAERTVEPGEFSSAAGPESLAVFLSEPLRRLRDLEVATADPVLRQELQSAGIRVRQASIPEYRIARAAVLSPRRGLEKSFLFAVARSRLRNLLSSPLMTLVTLAREEQRVERARNREANVLGDWEVASPSLAEEKAAEERLFETIASHHRWLNERLESMAKTVAPNLAAVVGGRTAARLIAVAGSVEALARVPAARVQLLGSRRRAGAGRGPRYGVLYRSPAVDQVPPARAGALARSLASLAVIAARADAVTHRFIAADLRTRLDRRIDELRRAKG